MILDDWTNGAQAKARRKTQDERRIELRRKSPEEIATYAKTHYGIILTNTNQEEMIDELLNQTT